uniref:Uncharacterized protein n=1 Tax=Arundo donax TaxID=35708 RepID=A0A0A8XZ33_ARUDO
MFLELRVQDWSLCSMLVSESKRLPFLFSLAKPLARRRSSPFIVSREAAIFPDQRQTIVAISPFSTSSGSCDRVGHLLPPGLAACPGARVQMTSRSSGAQRPSRGAKVK